MFEGRVLVHPLALMLGARTVDRPVTGHSLVASALVPFEIGSGRLVEPARWCQAIAALGGSVAPDSMAPLPGAELLVLTGPDAAREGRADIECGAIRVHVMLKDAGDGTFDTGPRGAVWRERENETGRRRAPSIVDRERPDRPVWLGPTPPDHPARLALAGEYGRESGGRWGGGASDETFYEAHLRFRAAAVEPRDRIRIDGLTPHLVHGRVPPWRVSIACATSEGVWQGLPARIHTLAVVPGAGLAAAAWRAAVALDPHDPLGLRIEALVAALDDDDGPERGAEDLGQIAVDRWTDPALALDDRPLLPRSLRPLHVPLGGVPRSDPAAERVADAMAWAEESSALPPDGNPFRGPDQARALREEIEAITEGRDPASLDTAAIGALGDRALAMARERHEAAGFGEPPHKDETPEERGAGLDAEIALRLETAGSSDRDRSVRDNLLAHGNEGLDADEVLTGLARTRAASPEPMTVWAPFATEEAVRFGDAFTRAFGAGSLPPHADVSHAVVEGQRIEGGSCVDVLAERTAWRDAELDDVRFEGGSLSGSVWSGVILRRCRFDGVNLSQARFEGCVFESCELAGVPASDLTLVEARFRDCRIERVDWTDPAFRDVTFVGGAWSEVALAEGLLVGTTIEETTLDRVTFLSTFAPETTLRRATLHKVWALGKGFPGSRIEDVSARTCGFVGQVHFDECSFAGSTFENTGFSGAVFDGARMDERTRFERCDFTGAGFARARIAGVTLVECGLCASTWEEVDATLVRMRGAVLRGVDLRTVDLAGAVIIESDLEGARFSPERTEGADLGKYVHAANGA